MGLESRRTSAAGAPETPDAARRASRRPRTRLEPAARQDQILDAAARVVLRDGIRAVGLERLARDLGISKALAYSYFRTRDALLAALLRREQAALRDGGMVAALRARSFASLLRQTTRAYLEQALTRGPLIWALLADPSVARLMEAENRVERETTIRFFVRATRRRYGLPLAKAITAVRLLMAVTGEAGLAVAGGELSVDEATATCVTLISGALGALARAETRTGKPPPLRS